MPERDVLAETPVVACGAPPLPCTQGRGDRRQEPPATFELYTPPYSCRLSPLPLPPTGDTISGRGIGMRFHSVVSDRETSAAAVEAVIEEVGSAGEGEGGSPLKVDVAFAFMTAHHRDDAEAVIERLWLELDPQTIVGCSAEGVIGGDKEIERQPGLAVLVAEMPLVRVHPFHIESETDWRHLLTDPAELVERVG